jgi:hypothetical protein
MLPKATDPAIRASDDRQEPTRNPGHSPVAGAARDKAGCGASTGHRVSHHEEDRVQDFLSTSNSCTAEQLYALSQPLRAADRSSVFPEVGSWKIIAFNTCCRIHRYLTGR